MFIGWYKILDLLRQCPFVKIILRVSLETFPKGLSIQGLCLVLFLENPIIMVYLLSKQQQKTLLLKARDPTVDISQTKR